MHLDRFCLLFVGLSNGFSPPVLQESGSGEDNRRPQSRR